MDFSKSPSAAFATCLPEQLVLSSPARDPRAHVGSA